MNVLSKKHMVHFNIWKKSDKFSQELSKSTSMGKGSEMVRTKKVMTIWLLIICTDVVTRHTRFKFTEFVNFEVTAKFNLIP